MKKRITAIFLALMLALASANITMADTGIRCDYNPPAATRGILHPETKPE